MTPISGTVATRPLRGSIRVTDGGEVFATHAVSWA
jgi:hypothetical protein